MTTRKAVHGGSGTLTMLRLLREVSAPQLRVSWDRTSLVVGGIAVEVRSKGV
jgi:hypothetical protein